MGKSLSNLRRKRSASTLRNLAPPPLATTTTPAPDLPVATLMTALHNVASYLVPKKQNLTLIGVGGIVNTVLLRSRTNTHDVDFFNDNLTTAEIKLLLDAAKSAVKKDSTLEQGWPNNHTVLFIPLHLRQTLTAQALSQHETVFQDPGLTIFADLWEYQICTKIDRLASTITNDAHLHDRNDLLHYLERYLSRNSAMKIPRSTIQSWFMQYMLPWQATNTDQILRNVNMSYKTTFSVHHDVIDFS